MNFSRYVRRVSRVLDSRSYSCRSSAATNAGARLRASRKRPGSLSWRALTWPKPSSTPSLERMWLASTSCWMSSGSGVVIPGILIRLHGVPLSWQVAPREADEGCDRGDRGDGCEDGDRRRRQVAAHQQLPGIEIGVQRIRLRELGLAPEGRDRVDEEGQHRDQDAGEGDTSRLAAQGGGEQRQRVDRKLEQERVDKEQGELPAEGVEREDLLPDGGPEKPRREHPRQRAGSEQQVSREIPRARHGLRQGELDGAVLHLARDGARS